MPVDNILVDRFNQLLDSRNMIHNESMYYSRHSYGDHYNRDLKKVSKDKWTIAEVICELYNQGYEFSQAQFNKYIERICFQKSNSYLLNGSNYSKESIKNSFQIMFTKFNPTEKQIKVIFGCYEKGYARSEFSWLKPLLDKGFILSENQQKILAKAGYKLHLLYDNKPITITELETIFTKIKDEDIDNITMLIEKNNIVPTTEMLKLVVSQLNFGRYSWGNDYQKQVKRSVEFATFLIERGAKPTAEIIINLMQQNPKFEYVKLMIDKVDEFPLEDIMKSFQINKLISLYLLLSKHKLEKEQLHELIYLDLSYSFTELAKLAPELNIEFTSDYKPSHEDLKIIQTYCDDDEIKNKESIEIFKDNKCEVLMTLLFVHHRGIKPDHTTLTKICYHLNYKIMRVLADHFGLIPTKVELDQAVKSPHGSNQQRTKMVEEILNYRIIPDQVTANLLDLPDIGLINLLIDHGMPIDYKLLGKLLSENYVLENIERVGLDYGEQLYHICHRAKFFPPQWIGRFKLDPRILEIRKLCQSKISTKDLLERCQAMDVHLDRYCLENLCLNSQDTTLDLIDSYGCIPTIYCLEYVYSSPNYTKNRKLIRRILEILSEKFDENHETLAQPYDIKFDMEPKHDQQLNFMHDSKDDDEDDYDSSEEDDKE